MQPLIIVGTGLAGYSLAKEFRKLNKEQKLLFLTADDGAYYSKPLLSNALAKGKMASELATASAEEMEQQLSACILTDETVVRINSKDKIIFTESNQYSYEKLILATGAQQIKPSFEGDAAADVLSVNNLSDYKFFRQKLDSVSSVAIIGAGLIGCEFANDISGIGKQVIVVAPGETPLSRLLPGEVAKHFMQQLADIGVAWKMGVKATHINKINDDYQITLSDHSTLKAELVLSSIGLHVDVSLANSANLDVNKGIKVDRFMQSSQKDIYAIGDCVEIEGNMFPFVLPIMHSARALAKTLNQTPTEVIYPAMPIIVKTPAFGVVACSVGDSTVGEWQIDEDGSGYQALCRNKEGQLLAYALTGSAVQNKQLLTKQLPKTIG